MVFSLLAGALLPFAFAPFGLYPLAILLLAVLFVFWTQSSARAAAWQGFAFGFGAFMVGTSWIYISLHDFGNMPAPLGAVAVMLLVIYLALFPALIGWLQAQFTSRALRLIVVTPALWAGLEWIRSWFLTGFPWLSVGYSQISGPLAGFAPYLGVYGVSWVTAVSAGVAAQLIYATPRARWGYGVLLPLIFMSGAVLKQVAWTTPLGNPISVALIQANIPLDIKWQPMYREHIMNLYASLSAQSHGSDLIIWPETAVPAYLDELQQGFLTNLRREAIAQHSAIVLGVVEKTPGRFPGAGNTPVYNSVVSIGDKEGIYRKHHLVPFGEYLPLSSWLSWLLEVLHIPMSDFSAWQGVQAPIPAANQKLGISICYEDVFGEEVIQELPAATLLVNVSEDAWFGRSWAAQQHLQMGRMRALETGRVLLSATNTGVSAVVGADGRVLAEAPPFTQAVLKAQVQPRQGATPYVRNGNKTLLLILVVLLIAGMAQEYYQRRIATSLVS